jgi:O-antigen ligase
VDWDVPRGIKIAFFFYFCVIFFSFVRMYFDPGPYERHGSRMSIILDFFISPLKFMMPALILFDSCRSPKRVMWATTAIMLGYFFLALQVVRYMGLHVYSGDELNKRGAKILHNSIGYDRVDIAMMLAGSVWGMIALASAMQKKWQWLLAWSGAAFILLAEMLTGGRTGYLACGMVGMILCVLRWRKLLLLMPVAGMAVVMLMPGVRERMFHGFDKQSGNIVIEQDHSEITSGRTTIWPYVIEKIKKSPVIGYGRGAMIRTGLAGWLLSELGEEFQHPHNAYLEMLMDNGIIGLICVLPFYYLTLKICLSMFRDKSDPVYEAAAGIALSGLLALIVTGFGAQTLYPREDTIWLWGAVGITVRLWIQRNQKQEEQMMSEEESEMGAGVLETEAVR